MPNVKTFLLFGVFFFGCFSARADFLDSDGILRKSDGSIRFMDHYEATGIDKQSGKKVRPDVCAVHGAHLPTILELAQISESFGAAGVLKNADGTIVSYEQARKIQMAFGYQLVKAINPDGSKNEFYYSFQGYHRPQGLLGDRRFWSSSIPDWEEFSKYAYIFLGINGNANLFSEFENLRTLTNPVRCISSRKAQAL